MPKSGKAATSLSALPPELAYVIAKYLPLKDLSRFTETTAIDYFLMRNYIENYFPVEIINKAEAVAKSFLSTDTILKAPSVYYKLIIGICNTLIIKKSFLLYPECVYDRTLTAPFLTEQEKSLSVERHKEYTKALSRYIRDRNKESLDEWVKICSSEYPIAWLNLDAKQISAAEAQALAEALKNPNCKLTSLYLDRNEIRATGAQALAEALKNPNCKLTSLHLHDNLIDATGAQALAEALKNPNCKLTSLHFRSNRIGTAGIQALAEALKNPNCKLTSLHLGGNEIGATGAQALADAIVKREHSHYSHVKISGIDDFEHYLQVAEKRFIEADEAAAKASCAFVVM